MTCLQIQNIEAKAQSDLEKKNIAISDLERVGSIYSCSYTVYDQNKVHAQTTKFRGCAMFKYLLEMVQQLLIYYEIDIISVFDVNEWEGKDSHPYY